MKTSIKLLLVLCLSIISFSYSKAQTPSNIFFLLDEASQYDPWEVVTKTITVPVNVPIRIAYNLYTYDNFDITSDNVVRVSRNTPTLEESSVVITSTSGVIYIHWNWCGGSIPSTVFSVKGTSYNSFENVLAKNNLSVTESLGIGTTTPSTVFQIKKADATTSLSLANRCAIDLWNPSSTINTGSQINFRSDGGTTLKAIGAVIGYLNKSSNYVGSAGDLVFGVKSSYSSTSVIQAMTIALGGNVGIGTTAPNTKLGVAGDIQLRGLDTKLRMGNADNDNFYGSVGFNNATNNVEIKHLYTNGGILFNTNTSNNAMYIASNGNVGIGTGVGIPLEKLQINGAIRGNLAAGALCVKTDYGSINVGPLNESGAHIYTDMPRFFMNKPIWSITGEISAYDATNLSLQTNGTPRMTILQSNGNIGIGTSSPNKKVEVTTSHQTNIDDEVRIGSYYNNNFYGLGLNYIIDNNGSPAQNIVTYNSGNKIKNISLFSNGQVSIGSDVQDLTQNVLFTVKGGIHAREIIVDLNAPLADFVFHPTYTLMPLPEVEQYVKTNSHLPEMPSAAEVSKNGMNMGEMQNKLLQKVEELTLYIIEQQKQIEALKTSLTSTKGEK